MQLSASLQIDKHENVAMCDVELLMAIVVR